MARSIDSVIGVPLPHFLGLRRSDNGGSMFIRGQSWRIGPLKCHYFWQVLSNSLNKGLTILGVRIGVVAVKDTVIP
jgi:hypothetical protein